MQLRYGTNPHQPAAMELTEPGNPPFRLISGAPSYINILDAVSAWQVVREASATFGVPAATSFKHVLRPAPISPRPSTPRWASAMASPRAGSAM
jgi:AICAR transformylase/IMP cyclohydrolase PurH